MWVWGGEWGWENVGGGTESAGRGRSVQAGDGECRWRTLTLTEVGNEAELGHHRLGLGPVGRVV